jgi:Family of unknown function (DUF6221)
VSDPVAFATARLDEAAALACLGINERVKIRRGVAPSRWLTSPDRSDITDEGGILRVRHTWVREGEHIARHDPARVLREVEAGRRIVARHRDCGDGMGYCGDGGHGGDVLCPDMADLLVRWADHPDYDESWKP